MPAPAPTADLSDLPGPRSLPLGIFWISVLGLFLELLLIRWIGTEIRIFAYLQNTVLVVCFLGLGAGLFTSRRPVRLGRMISSLLILAGLLNVPATREGFRAISELLSVLGDMNIWHAGLSTSPMDTVLRVAVGLGMTLLVMILMLEAFIPIGRILGRMMNAHPRPIVAYSINVAGSLVGTWAFVALSVMAQPPTTWFAMLFVLLLPAFVGIRPRPWLKITGAAAIVALSWYGSASMDADEVVWSPYQKLALEDMRAKSAAGHFKSPHDYLIRVNNAGYQGMVDLGIERQRAHPELFDARQVGLSQYDIPSLVHPNPRSMLIVGAGSGNDAAGALRNGVEQVTAVEIDPVIVEFGRRFHPERPYDSDRVHVVIDDARSFFARTDQTYDVISFGLLDSHTTTAMTNARLDHYVYTRESLERAKQLLNDGGIVCLSFEAFKPFIADRMAGVLRDVFEQDPLVFRIPVNPFGWGGVFFIVGDLQAARAQIAGDARLASLIEAWQKQYPVNITYTTSATTDDWPYVYLERPQIPMLYGLLAGLVLLLMGYLRRIRGIRAGLNPTGWNRSHWHFFFLGAAFLLLEVQNISKASVVLGSTWLVNAVIITGVLIMVLVANFIASVKPKLPVVPIYVLLCGTALGLYFIDLARFGFLPFATKAIVVGTLTTLPLLFSGIVFVRAFAATRDRDLALGANLLGALFGALLQSLSFLIGIKSLLLIVALMYGMAMLSRPRMGVDRDEESSSLGRTVRSLTSPLPTHGR